MEVEEYIEDMYPEQFEIRRVLNKRVNQRTGKIEYLVQWKLWPHDTTWEPIKNIKSYLIQHNLLSKSDDYDQQPARKAEQRERVQEKWEDYEKTQNDSDKELNDQISSLQTKYQFQLDNSGSSDKQQEDHTPLNGEGLSLSNENEDVTGEKEENYDCQLIYKILDKKVENDKLSYLVLFYDRKDPIWIDNERLIGYENDIEEFENNLQTKYNQEQQQQQECLDHNFTKNNQTQNCADEEEEHASTVNSTPSAIEKKVNSEFQQFKPNKQIMKKKIEEDIPLNIGYSYSDKIESIESVVRYSYKINWKRRQDGTFPSPKQVRFEKKGEITPQQLIDQLVSTNFNQTN